MRQIILLLSGAGILLSACGMQPATSTPAPAQTEIPAEVVTDVPVLPSSTSFVPTATEFTGTVQDTPVSPGTETTPSPKLPAPSFESQTYSNEEVGFVLDYPAGWTVNEVVVGSRGTQIQFLSAPEVADMPVVPENATRLNATVYQWEPKNDLPAYIANWKTSWEASGFTVLEEEQLTLELGLPAVQYTIQTPDADVVFLVTAIGDQYLVLSGEGNLELVKEIVQRVRPISR